ncbi:MAG: hypothetical protein P9L92_18090 [Candidatus Electryonea clarkiae]|nr:hypothetical protein [Candidatus Electryonea clarkiae]MDP8288191.1 hypothetical protein [Candidatus Electryonea clarkiae]
MMGSKKNDVAKVNRQIRINKQDYLIFENLFTRTFEYFTSESELITGWKVWVSQMKIVKKVTISILFK